MINAKNKSGFKPLYLVIICLVLLISAIVIFSRLVGLFDEEMYIRIEAKNFDEDNWILTPSITSLIMFAAIVAIFCFSLHPHRSNRALLIVILVICLLFIALAAVIFFGYLQDFIEQRNWYKNSGDKDGYLYRKENCDFILKLCIEQAAMLVFGIILGVLTFVNYKKPALDN